METFVGYISDHRLFSDLITFSMGLRYNRTILHSDFIDTTLYKFPFTEIDINTGALTGSAGCIITPSKSLRFNLILSSGFRSPNVDDYGKVFDKDEFVVVPNADLKPEYIYNGELGMRKSFLSDAVEVTASVYYTYMTDAIVRRQFQLNGNDSLVYDGETLRIQANTNAGEAVIYGGYCGLAEIGRAHV